MSCFPWLLLVLASRGPRKHDLSEWNQLTPKRENKKGSGFQRHPDNAFNNLEVFNAIAVLGPHSW